MTRRIVCYLEYSLSLTVPFISLTFAPRCIHFFLSYLKLDFSFSLLREFCRSLSLSLPRTSIINSPLRVLLSLKALTSLHSSPLSILSSHSTGQVIRYILCREGGKKSGSIASAWGVGHAEETPLDHNISYPR